MNAKLELPEPDEDAALPIVLAKDGAVVLSYMSFVARRDACVIVSFPICFAHRFEPKESKGCAAYEVKDSPWAKEAGLKAKHFVFEFPGKTFECLAEDFGSEISDEDDDAVKLMAKRLYK